MIDALAGWLLNYLVHSTVLLGAVWALERGGLLKHPAWREALWRWAFFGAVLTASVQPLTQGTRIALPDVWATAREGASALGVGAAHVDSDGADASDEANAIARRSGGSMDLVLTRDGRAGQPDAARGQAISPVDIAGTTDAADTGALALERRRALLRDALAALLFAWPVVAASGLGLTLLRWLALRREVRSLPLFDDPELRQAAAELAQQAGVRTPTLRLSPAWPSPLVAPGGQICLPAALMRSLDGQQRVAVLAHEIAHLRRRDLGWRLAARLVSQLGWLQPMNRLAMRRLDLLAELACDAWAAAEAGAMPLAESLYVCARDGAAAAAGASAAAAGAGGKRRGVRRASRPMPVLASAMAATRSPLMARMDALLEPSPMNESTPGRRRLARVALAGGLCVIALAVPMLVIGKAPRIKVDLGAVIGDRKVTRYVHDDNGHEQRASYDGDIVFNEAQTDVVSLDRKLEVSETQDGVTRRAEIANDGQGGTTRRYWVDDRARPLDAEGQQWLAAQIGLVAELTQGSEQRARRLLKQGGTAAVLADVGRSRDSLVRRSRIEALLATGPQDDATLSRLIALSAQLDGDFERRSALEAVLNHRTLGASLQRELLAVTGGMEGAFERRQVLEAIAPQLSAEASAMSAWQKAVRGIDGDFEQRSAIVALIEARPRVDRDLAFGVLGAMDNLHGDFERAQVLMSLAERMPADAELIARYRQAARGLSTHERGRVEEALDHLSPA